MQGFRVIKSGFFSTFQDDGRMGAQHKGIPLSGVMDHKNAKMASALVGGQSVVLEVTLIGPELEFLKGMSIGITGGLNAYLNGNRIPSYKTLSVKRNDRLELKPGRGFRGYISFSDKLCLNEAFSSMSTYTKASLGGYKGRQLMKNDCVEVEPIDFSEEYYLSEPRRNYTIRVMKGMEYEQFTNMDSFFSESYIVTDEMDRMGMRLKGLPILSSTSDIISSPVIPGTIQVPASGQPIIMLKDAQTIGGYTRLGCVITSDLDDLAQMKPGDTINFKSVTREEALTIKNDYIRQLSQIIEDKGHEKDYYTLSVNNRSFDVSVEER